jgi:hypothetical protein
MALSAPRRIICDYLHFARQIPSVPVQRRMQLASLMKARQAASPRPSWSTLFLKAYALVCTARPALRRVYLWLPWPHLFEHSWNVINVAIERQLDGEDAVFFELIHDPELRSIPELDRHLRALKEQPIEQVPAFRRLLLFSRVPRPLRRLLWWLGLNFFMRKRAQLYGTGGLSVYSSLGAASLHPISLLPTTLNYGVIDAEGNVDVRLTYDHRVLDGATVARALAELEQVLHTAILTELRALAGTALEGTEVDTAEAPAVQTAVSVLRSSLLTTPVPDDPRSE